MKIAEIVAVEHPQFVLSDQAGTPNERYRLWMATFRSVPGAVAMEAVEVHLRRSGWAPKVSDVVRIIREAERLQKPTETDGFGQLLKLIRRFGYHQERLALQWCKRHNPALGATIKRLGWREICVNDNVDAVRAHFYKTYKQYDERKEARRELKKLAPMVRNLLSEASATNDLNAKIGWKKESKAHQRDERTAPPGRENYEQELGDRLEREFEEQIRKGLPQ